MNRSPLCYSKTKGVQEEGIAIILTWSTVAQMRMPSLILSMLRTSQSGIRALEEKK
jgi:hypothetical protein